MASNEHWESLTPMSTERYCCAAAATDGRLFVFSGCDGSSNLSSAAAYDPRTDTWEDIDPMSKERFGCAAAAIGDQLFVCGGSDYGYNKLSSAEMYDVRSGTWTSLPPMSTKRVGCAAAAVGDRLFVCGGEDDSGNELSSAEFYDTRTEGWTPIPSMSTERWGCAAAAVGGHLYVFGGWDGISRLSSVERFDEDSEGWKTLPPMRTARCDCAAAVVGEQIFVCGGWDDSDNELSSVEIFDTSLETWSSMSSMTTKSSGCTAASLEGRLFAIGGSDGTNRLASAEAITVGPKTSPFYEKLLEEDDRNVHLKISELVAAVEDVHQLKMLYTLVNACHRLGYIDQDDRASYVRSALEKVSVTTTCDDSVTFFKLALKKAKEDSIIDDYTMFELDRRAEVAHTSNAPFVKDLWKHIHANTERIQKLEARMDRVEAHVDELGHRVDRVESCCRDLHTSLVKLHKGLRYQKKVEATVGIMGAVLNAVSFGVAGSVASGALGLAINSIVDFGDLSHIQAVVEGMGDVTVKKALETGLQLIEDSASRKLYSAAKEGTTILEGRVHAELIAAANDGNPLVAIAVTAQVVSRNFSQGQGSGTVLMPGSENVRTPQASPPPATSLTVNERIKRLEEQLALGAVPTIMMKRIENVELNLFGDAQKGTLLERITGAEKVMGL